MRYGHKLRRLTDHKALGEPNSLAPDHVAAVTGHTRYPKMVRDARSEANILKSGQHSRKIGKFVVKGRLAGAPLFTLTLEERATCPRSCLHWLDCYGNKMHWSRRLRPSATLEAELAGELACHQHNHPGGFLVRLHVLGDFYSVAYVELWRAWLKRYPALNVFGYTAWRRGTPIGDAVTRLRSEQWERFAIRTSDGGEGEYCTASIDTEAEAGDAIVCPAQTEKTECCATCALCWATPKNIAFLRH